jgi:hypothetical protein
MQATLKTPSWLHHALLGDLGSVCYTGLGDQEVSVSVVGDHATIVLDLRMSIVSGITT